MYVQFGKTEREEMFPVLSRYRNVGILSEVGIHIADIA